MRKFYEDPEIEVIELDALIATEYSKSDELGDYTRGDGEGVGGLLD